MSVKVCKNGHTFEKTSDCPVCPLCSREEMSSKYGEEFPSIGAPAFRALDRAGITTLKDLTSFSAKELLALHGFCPKALRLLQDSLEKRKMSLMKK